MIKFFRIISLLEGLSYLAILSVTLGYISRDYVSSIGMTHGILFMIYMILAMSNNTGWTSRQQLLLMAAALIPFAFIPTEIYLQKAEQKKTGVKPVFCWVHIVKEMASPFNPFL